MLKKRLEKHRLFGNKSRENSSEGIRKLIENQNHINSSLRMAREIMEYIYIYIY